MARNFVEKFLKQVAEYSTLVGRFWIPFFFVLRVLLVALIAEPLFRNEEEQFACNILTRGCQISCFNYLTPISLIRLWTLQILCVALPTIVFMIYTAYKITKIDQAKKLRIKKKVKTLRKKDRKKAAEERRQKQIQDGKPLKYQEISLAEIKEKQNYKDDYGDDEVVASKFDADTPSRLMITYIAPILSRLAIEIGFTIVQFNIYVFKFWIPELFKCLRWPCSNIVDCYISRSKEKTTMLWVMFGITVILITLNIIELYYFGIIKLWDAWKTRGQNITKEYKL